MHEPQRMVEEFHRALKLPVGHGIAFRQPDLRRSLIKEESKELREAIKCRNIVKTIDGICDLLVVTYGTAVNFGIDVEPFFAEVHRTNMAKEGGPVRADGKRLKPEGWTPPEIERILAEMS